MRRVATILALAAAAALLAGCVYDPYTGTWMPCCGYYGNPYYGYPGPYAPYGYPPYGGPQAQQPGMYQAPPGGYQAPPGGYQGPPGGYQGAPSGYQGPPGGYQGPQGPTSSAAPRTALAQRFAAANVTHDGRLTRQQAAAGMPLVAQNFDAIDLDQKGYVTLPEIRVFIARQQAAGGQPGQTDQD